MSDAKCCRVTLAGDSADWSLVATYANDVESRCEHGGYPVSLEFSGLSAGEVPTVTIEFAQSGGPQ